MVHHKNLLLLVVSKSTTNQVYQKIALAKKCWSCSNDVDVYILS